MRAALPLALAAGLLVAPLACKQEGRAPRGKPSESQTPVRGGTLRIATFSDIRSLDPATTFDLISGPIVNMLFAGLVDYDAQGNIVPDLAERFEALPGGLGYRFFLRPNLHFHDGGELGAEDVRRSIERALHPDTPCPGVSFFEKVDGFADFQAKKSPHLRGVVVEGPNVVAIHLTEPDATFLPVLALPFLRPVCKSGGSLYNDAFQNQACGAGPFKLETWQPGRQVKLRRFDQYHVPGLPHLDGIEMRFDLSRLTQRLLFEQGELDGIFNEFERPGAIWFRTHPEWSKYFHEAPAAEVYGDFMNVEMRPFDDVRIRKAVAAALDRPNLAKYYEGWTIVTGHLIPPGIPGHELHVPYEQTYDLPRARALMAEAGYPYDPATGKGGWPETIVYHAGEGESAVRYAQLLQHDLAQIGIRIEVKEASFPQYLAVAGRRKTATMGFAGWAIDFADPSDFFEPILTTRSITEEDSQNKAFYSNPKLDALIDTAHRELDQKKRLVMYREAEQIVCDEAPWSFTYFSSRIWITQPWVRGYAAHPVWDRHMLPVWIDSSAKQAKLARFGPALGALVR
ncbi:MAG: ABC transporter substrate-binding protein [Polyangiales bacterium]